MSLNPAHRNYCITIENWVDTYTELEPIYRQHYGEMKDRLTRDGHTISDFNPRKDRYIAAADGGWLLTYVVRLDGEAVGYSNVYLTNDMHNGDFIATEDAIYILPEHRNGIGKTLVKHILSDLRQRGVKRALVTPVTDLRVAKIWKRMGFKETATLMTYEFGE